MTRDSVGAPWNDPVRVWDTASIYHDWAPDGSGVLCIRMRDNEVVLVSPDGDVLMRRPMPEGITKAWNPRFYWESEQTVYFRGDDEDGTVGLWSMPFEGGDATLVVHYDDPSVWAWGNAVDNGTYYIGYSKYESDIWVMDLEW